eukprot:3460217-Rhodomonas_salina.1
MDRGPPSPACCSEQSWQGTENRKGTNARAGLGLPSGTEKRDWIGGDSRDECTDSPAHVQVHAPAVADDGEDSMATTRRESTDA